jgi:Xaa-Pro aminopeptidase
VGQYPDGTTDVTRTVIVGTPTAEMKDRFTRVLQGHIAVAMARFPEGTRGSSSTASPASSCGRPGSITPHGTGHGVGSFSSVHEGPQRISPVGQRPGRRRRAAQAGMFLSNEPGYYKTGEYGIRVENLVLIVPRQVRRRRKEMLGFETLTFAPIDRHLIDTALLTREERALGDDYHAQVLEVVGAQLDGEALTWLEAQCRPLED